MNHRYQSRIGLNCMQWNSRSLLPKKSELQHILFSHHITIAIISETWLKPSTSVNFYQYNMLRHDRTDGWGGAALLIRNH